MSIDAIREDFINNLGTNDNSQRVYDTQRIANVEKSSLGESKDEYSKRDLDKAIVKLNKFLEEDKTHVEISMHDKFNTVMIKIIDDKSGDVIMEVPPKKILDMVAKMCELMGVLFDKNA
ncbi:MAG: flagellar protein FlaG [Clostridium sp.]|nr:flagellar protein FlaG [Clostridium sp.]